MKRTIILSSVLACVVVLCMGNAWEFGISQTRQVTKGLVSYWSMRNSGTTVYDEIGSEPGLAVGGVIFAYTNGVAGNGGYFDGNDDYINIGDSVSYDGDTTQSMSFWINADSFVSGAVMVRKWKAGEAAFLVQLSIDSPYSGVLYGISDGTNLVIKETPKTVLTVNVWHHVVVIWNGGDSFEAYIDAESQSLSVYSSAGSGSPSSINNAAENLAIGARYNGGSVDGFFKGSIDEVRIYNRSLSAAEAKQLYRMGKTIYNNR